MEKYIVRINNPRVRGSLEKIFGNVGTPRAIHKTVIITTDRPKKEIEKVPGVISVQENETIYLAFVQETPPNWALPVICDMENQYVYEKTGNGVDIYILDSGIKSSHVEFTGRVTTIYSQDGSDCDANKPHGTIVASQAAGSTCGVAKQANILNARMRVNDSLSVLKALDRVLEHHIGKSNSNPSILNMSFGSTNLAYLKDETLDLVEHGVICVASAHNFGTEGSTAPACHPHVVSVGATDFNNNLAYFSNWGSDIDILAPGYANRAADLDGYSTTHYGNYYGTSFSCPLVVGALALIAEGKTVNNINDVERMTSVLLNYADTSKVTIPSDKIGTTNRLLFSLMPTSSANLFLDLDEQNINIANSGTFIYGQQGYESVNIYPGVVSITVNGNVEEVFLHFSISEYTFLQRGNGLLVYRDGLLILIISVQSWGLSLVFGAAYAVTISDGGMIRINGIAVSTEEPKPWGAI